MLSQTIKDGLLVINYTTWARVNSHPPMHQCGWMVHTFFIPPCPLANQGVELYFILFFSSAQVGLFLRNVFFPPPMPIQVSPTYLLAHQHS
jgi:hypothetical protein